MKMEQTPNVDNEADFLRILNLINTSDNNLPLLSRIANQKISIEKSFENTIKIVIDFRNWKSDSCNRIFMYLFM